MPDGTTFPAKPDPSEAVKLWERVMGLDRNAPTAEEDWNVLVYANLHGIGQEEARVILKGRAA